MKYLILFLLNILFILNSYSQDLIYTINGEEIIAKVKEIQDSSTVFYKFENTNGPIYTKSNKSISKIVFKNGQIEEFNKDPSAVIQNIIPESSNNLNDLTKKGNSVYVEILDEASRAGERYFIDALKEWRYWKVVKNKNQANFVIDFNIDKRAFLDKSVSLTFKTRDDKEFLKSPNYRATVNLFNGYNPFKGAANKVVRKYLRKQFKE